MVMLAYDIPTVWLSIVHVSDMTLYVTMLSYHWGITSLPRGKQFSALFGDTVVFNQISSAKRSPFQNIRTSVKISTQMIRQCVICADDAADPRRVQELSGAARPQRFDARVISITLLVIVLLA